jgi:2'-5' RNA ligase
MRLFVAVHVSEVARARAADVRHAVERLEPELAARGMRWVQPAQMHVTLRFLGALDGALADAVVSAMEGQLRLPAFDIGFGTPSWLPVRRPPRVLVLPVEGGLDPLSLLKRAIDERLPPGTPADQSRAFRPHLTIARIRDEWQRRAASLPMPIGDVAPVSEGGRVDAAVLFESQLGPRGPVYHERARLRLVGQTG